MRKNFDPPIKVETKGGNLCVGWGDWRKAVDLTGEAKIVYEGYLVNPVATQKE
jgi:diaminopimelate epimerase